MLKSFVIVIVVIFTHLLCVYGQFSKYQNIVPRHYNHIITELEDLKYQQIISTFNMKTTTKSDENRVISFTLYGNDKKYTYGAIRNAVLAPRYYPGWTVRFYGR